MREDLISILNYVRGYMESRTLILVTTGLFALIGLFHGCTSSEKFDSTSKFLVQLSDPDAMSRAPKESGRVIGNVYSDEPSLQDVSVVYYPKILQSQSFRKELLKTPIYSDQERREVTLREYLLEIDKPDGIDYVLKYTIGLPKLIFGDDDPPSKIIDSLIYFTEEDIKINNDLDDMLVFELDEDDGSNLLTATLSDPIGVAQVAERARQLLQSQILDYRVQKAKREFEFIDEQYQEKKEEFFKTQASLASYADRNMFNSTRLSNITKDRLEMEFETQKIAYSELEASRIRQSVRVEEATPSFVTLVAPTVPIEPSSWSTVILVAVWAGCGFIASMLFYVCVTSWRGTRRLYKETGNDDGYEDHAEYA